MNIAACEWCGHRRPVGEDGYCLACRELLGRDEPIVGGGDGG